MQQAGKTFMMWATVILVLMPMARAQQVAEEMSYRQARRTILVTSKYAGAVQRSKMFHYFALNRDSIRSTHDTLDFDATSRKGETLHFQIALREIDRVSTKCSSTACWLMNGSRKEDLLRSDDSTKTFGLDFGIDDGPMVKRCGRAQNTEECLQAADRFAAALNSLHAYALGPVVAEEDFHQQAVAWRALATKPALPEAARVRRLMAEDALKNQKPEEALKYYEQGLDLCPMWPEGWFNAAVVAGELGRYADAAEEMQNYLELVPNAKDAQAARDQIAIWQYKAGQPATGVAR